MSPSYCAWVEIRLAGQVPAMARQGGNEGSKLFLCLALKLSKSRLPFATLPPQISCPPRSPRSPSPRRPNNHSNILHRCRSFRRGLELLPIVSSLETPRLPSLRAQNPSYPHERQKEHRHTCRPKCSRHVPQGPAASQESPSQKCVPCCRADSSSDRCAVVRLGSRRAHHMG